MQFTESIAYGPRPIPVRLTRRVLPTVVAIARTAGVRRDVRAMARMLIRVEAELSDELSGAFPHLTARSHPASTTITGDVADQQELQGVLNLLSSLGIDVIEVLTIPED